jgi:hypothetical protein
MPINKLDDLQASRLFGDLAPKVQRLLLAHGNANEQQKLLYMWVKQGQINLSQFRKLLDFYTDD